MKLNCIYADQDAQNDNLKNNSAYVVFEKITILGQVRLSLWPTVYLQKPIQKRSVAEYKKWGYKGRRDLNCGRWLFF